MRNLFKRLRISTSNFKRRMHILQMPIAVRWKRNVRKRAAILGLQGRDDKENTVPARSMGPMCNCKNECFEKMGPELQFHILTTFNNLGSKERQDQ